MIGRNILGFHIQETNVAKRAVKAAFPIQDSPIAFSSIDPAMSILIETRGGGATGKKPHSYLSSLENSEYPFLVLERRES